MDNKETRMLVLAILIAGMLLIVPNLLRAWNNNPYVTNSDSYYSIRIYNTVDKSFYDALESHNVPFNLLYLLPKDETFMMKYLGLALALGTIIVGYLIMKKHNMPAKIIWAILLLLVMSPIFIHTFISFNTDAIIIFLCLLSVMLLAYQKPYFAFIPFIITPFIDIYGAFAGFLFLAMYALTNSRNIKNIRLLGWLSLASLVGAIILNISIGYNIMQPLYLQQSNIITDIGADIGFSFSSIILSLIGLILLWEKGLRNAVIYITILILLVVSVFSTTLRIYLNMLLVVYAGFAFIYLSRRKWSIQLIKQITILLIICSIMFTTLVYESNLVKSKPDADYADAFSFIKMQSFPDETVLSSADNGYLIEYYSDRHAFITPNTRTYEPQLIDLDENLSTSRNLESTESIIHKYNIKYILIDPAYQQYLEQKAGLYFLIESSNKFKQIYKNEEVEVWIYTGAAQNPQPTQ